MEPRTREPSHSDTKFDLTGVSCPCRKSETSCTIRLLAGYFEMRPARAPLPLLGLVEIIARFEFSGMTSNSHGLRTVDDSRDRASSQS